MNAELVTFHQRIITLTRPEELFGTTATLVTVKAEYHKFCHIAHADKYQRADEKRLATITFQKLNELHKLAVDAFEQGVYGKAAPTPKTRTPPTMRTKKGIYVVTGPLSGGDISSVYTGEYEGKTPVIIKIANAPGDNIFMAHEATALTVLNKAAEGSVSHSYFIPTLLDAFEVKINGTNRRVNVFNDSGGLRTLHDVVSQYPGGVSERTFIWVMKRLFSTLAFAHSCNVVHGSVLPPHILLHPVTHGVRLLDWCFATSGKIPALAMSNVYASWYPPEVAARQVITPATDIYMLAHTMCYLLGGDFGEIPKSVHPKFRRFLEACLIKHPARRPQSAWECRKELSNLALEVVGPKKYEELVMV